MRTGIHAQTCAGKAEFDLAYYRWR
jgi:hypothetical protein